MAVVRRRLRVLLFCCVSRADERVGWLYLLALGVASLLLALPSPAQAAAPDLVVLGANVDESSPEAVGPRDPNTNYVATVRLTAPAAVGTYYYGACVDGVPGESDRANNCSESVEVQVLGIQVDRFASPTLALDVGGAAVPDLGSRT